MPMVPREKPSVTMGPKGEGSNLDMEPVQWQIIHIDVVIVNDLTIHKYSPL